MSLSPWFLEEKRIFLRHSKKKSPKQLRIFAWNLGPFNKIFLEKLFVILQFKIRSIWGKVFKNVEPFKNLKGYGLSDPLGPFLNTLPHLWFGKILVTEWLPMSTKSCLVLLTFLLLFICFFNFSFVLCVINYFSFIFHIFFIFRFFTKKSWINPWRPRTPISL